MTDPRITDPLTPVEREALRVWRAETDAAWQRIRAELIKRPTRLHCDSFRITPKQMRELRIPRDVPRLPDHLHHLAPRLIEPKPPTEAEAERYLVAHEGQSVPVRWHGGAPAWAGLPDPAWPILLPRRFARGGWFGSAEPSSTDQTVPGWTDDPHEAVATARRVLSWGDVAYVRFSQHWFRDATVRVDRADLAGRRAALFQALAWGISVDQKRVVVGGGLPVGQAGAPYAVLGALDPAPTC